MSGVVQGEGPWAGRDGDIAAGEGRTETSCLGKHWAAWTRLHRTNAASFCSQIDQSRDFRSHGHVTMCRDKGSGIYYRPTFFLDEPISHTQNQYSW